MKKLLALVLVAVLALTMLTACSSNEDNAVTIASAADLAGKKIAVQEGTTGDALVTEEVEGAEISRFKKVVDAGLDLKAGKVDAVVVDDLVAKKLVGNIEGLKILDEALSVEEYAIAVKKGNTELLDKINASIEKMLEDGTIDEFCVKYAEAE